MTEIRKYREAEEVRTDALIPYERNAKVHDEKQIKNVAQSIIDRWESFTGEKAERLS